jgi:hypothetical protein
LRGFWREAAREAARLRNAATDDGDAALHRMDARR